MVAKHPKRKILTLLKQLYSAEAATNLLSQIEERLVSYAKDNPSDRLSVVQSRLSQKDALLITYADMLQDARLLPLETLQKFAQKYLQGVVSGIHLLPFYPHSSDDGFSVIDYHQVDPALGDWADIQHLSQDFALMFDVVVNHVSSQSAWFQGFLRGDPRYQDYFITIDDAPDLTMVVRPRTTPLLTYFDTLSGSRQVWTTFSADQIDLNYKNPKVLLELVDLLLFYAAHGAQLIRLDAIAFVWKEPGTPCVHLPQTHAIVRLIRAIYDWVTPYMLIITETNVPHADNLSYFGDGSNEAHLVYNFTLPPLLLHTFRTGNCSTLNAWVDTFKLPSDQITFFNFLASHDGIGLNPARGILSDAEIEALVNQAERHGGLVSYKANANGSRSPYELNINYYDALNDPQSLEPLDLQVDRFICSQAVMLSLVGLPGIYFHSLFGSRGWTEGVKLLGYTRAINRRKLSRMDLEQALDDPDARRAKIYSRYKRLLLARASRAGFDPYGEQQSISLGPEVFGLMRWKRRSPADRIICLHNITAKSQSVALNFEQIGIEAGHLAALTDLVTEQVHDYRETLTIELAPYQVCWLARAE